MEISEDDEGYTSPSENGLSQFTCTKGGSLLSSKSLSWTGRVLQHQQKKKVTSNQEFTIDEEFLSYVTDNKENSGKIVDMLWQIVPEVPGYYNGTGNQFVGDLNSSIRNLKTRTEKPVYRDLTEFICDTMDLLCGKPSLIFELQSDGTFCKNPIILIHGLTPFTISNYCDSFLTMGSSVLKLSQIDDQLHYSGSSLSSKVFIAFVNFVKDYIKVYQTIIMLKRSSIVSLTTLRKFIMPYCQQVLMLCHIVENEFCGHPLILLKNINNLMLMHESPGVSDMLQSLFITCVSAYSKYVSDWIYEGSLGPPSEFHITRSRLPVSRDRKYWTHQFTQNEDIPLFLKGLNTPMFETGKVINLLKEFQRKDLPIFFGDGLGSPLKFHLSHDEIIIFINLMSDRMSQFLTRNGHLLKEIEETVRRTTIKEDFAADIDPIVIAQNYKELETRFRATKLQTFLEHQEKKHAELLQVQQHLQEARNVRLREAIDELFEEKKRKLYWEEKERKDTEKGYKLLREHYGEFLETVNLGIKELQKSPQTEEVMEQSIYGISLLEDIHRTPLLPLHGSGDCNVQEESREQCTEEKQISTISIHQELITPLPLESRDEDNVTESKSPILFSKSKSESDSAKSVPKGLETKMKAKYFKTRDATPVQLDLDMFDKPLMPSCSEKSVEQTFCTNECDSYLVQRFLSLSIEIPLLHQNKAVNLYLLHHIIVTQQLLRHVKALNDFMLLQNGQFGHFLTMMLIDMVQSGKLKKREDIISQIVTINSLLEESLSMVVDDEDLNFLQNQLSFIVLPEQVTATATENVEKKKKRTLTSEFDVLNSLCLRHTVDWPLNIIFTDELLRKYESAFSFQMRLVRAEILLGKVATLIKSKTGDVNQLKDLNIYRYLMLRFVRMVRSYVNLTVIHTSWTELASSFSKMDSLKIIYDSLVHHIKTITSNCLLGLKAKPVMKLLTDQLIVIEAFCSKLDSVAHKINWAKGDKVGHADYKMLVRMYLVFKEIETIFSQVVKKNGIDIIGIAT